MIIRYRTTKAPKGQQTAASGAGAAPLPVVLSALRALVVSLRIIINNNIMLLFYLHCLHYYISYWFTG